MKKWKVDRQLMRIGARRCLSVALCSMALLEGCTLDNPAVYERANQDLDGIQLGLFGVVMLIILLALLRTPDARRRRRVELPVAPKVAAAGTQHLAQALLRSKEHDERGAAVGLATGIVRAAEATARAAEGESIIIELGEEDRWSPDASTLDTPVAGEGLLDWATVEREYAACIAARGAQHFLSAYAPATVRRVAALADQLEIWNAASAPFWMLRNGREARIYPSLSFYEDNAELFRPGREAELRRVVRGVFHVDIGGTTQLRLVDPAAVRVSDRQIRVVSPGVIAIPAR